jgi:hypothetical protein
MVKLIIYVWDASLLEITAKNYLNDQIEQRHEWSMWQALERTEKRTSLGGET